LNFESNYRWRIVALLFFATTINYIDRNVLSFTMIDEGFRKTMLGLSSDSVLTETNINLFKERMGFIDAAFKTAYALGFLFVGWFIDKVGTRKGFSLSIIVWSLASVLHGFVSSIRGLAITRFILGIGEAGNFPSAVKSVAEWFPKKERAMATGVFNAGSNIGIIFTAFSVPFITLHYGWRMSFVITGLLGFILLIAWLRIYKRPEQLKDLSEQELAHIKSDEDERHEPAKRISWSRLITFRQTWAIAVCKFLADPIWYFYLTWLPDFFNSNEALDQKLDLKNISFSFLIIYLVSDAGSIFFGWMSSQLIQRGWTVNRARKVTLLLCAICVAPIFLASTTHHLWVAVALISLAAAAHQGWSANVYTMSSDMFPKNSVSSVMGIGGLFGATGGIILAATAGIVRVKFGYVPLFVLAATSYSLAWGIMCWLVPRWERIGSRIDTDS
jgi:ACS family hexuronate transporter-like MFS transporter